MCRLLYWFSQRAPIEQIAHYTGLKPATGAKACDYISECLSNIMINIGQAEMPSVSPETVTCVDATYFTKPTRMHGGRIVRTNHP